MIEHLIKSIPGLVYIGYGHMVLMSTLSLHSFWSPASDLALLNKPPSLFFRTSELDNDDVIVCGSITVSTTDWWRTLTRKVFE